MMQPENLFVRLLASGKPLILDGGFATQLESQGCVIKDALWSAGLLLKDPQSIAAAHRAYIDAGVDILATAGYQASRRGFMQQGYSADEADAAIRQSVSLARQAASLASRPIVVAASIGPYGAILHDGSEYHGNYGVSDAHLRSFHEERTRFIAATDIDVLAFETVPSEQEARVLADLLRQFEMPAWVSFSCRDGDHLCDGSSIERVAALFAGHPQVVALGVNCTAPQYISEVLAHLGAGAPDKALLAYPNSGETYDPETGDWYGTADPPDYATAARQWVAAGAQIVGGCCRTGPEHIRAIVSALDH